MRCITGYLRVTELCIRATIPGATTNVSKGSTRWRSVASFSCSRLSSLRWPFVICTLCRWFGQLIQSFLALHSRSALLTHTFTITTFEYHWDTLIYVSSSFKATYIRFTIRTSKWSWNPTWTILPTTPNVLFGGEKQTYHPRETHLDSSTRKNGLRFIRLKP